MLCQNCGKNEANIRYTQIVNGQKKEMILCEECAEKLGISNFKINMPIHFSNFFDSFFEEEPMLTSFMKEKNDECENCKESYNQFIKTGLLGCADCYDEFEDRLEPLLKQLQGSTKHIGRKPLNINAKMNNTGENVAKNAKENKEEKKNTELETLKEELANAIKEERYEDAATLRDKIKKLNEGK